TPKPRHHGIRKNVATNPPHKQRPENPDLSPESLHHSPRATKTSKRTNDIKVENCRRNLTTRNTDSAASLATRTSS
ncbi:unnamed protein product, partial [Brassica oleracea var. botrytis]